MITVDRGSTSMIGVSAPLHAGIHPLDQRQKPPPRTRHPPSRHPPQRMLGDMGNKRAVRILLECILVLHYQLGAFLLTDGLWSWIPCNNFWMDPPMDSKSWMVTQQSLFIYIKLQSIPAREQFLLHNNHLWTVPSTMIILVESRSTVIIM